MVKRLMVLGMTLALFIGGTATSSVLAGTDQSIQIKEDVQETNQSEDDKIEPQATPLAAAGWVGGAFVTGAVAKAGADAYDWAKGKLIGKSTASTEYDHDEIKVVFDQ